MERQSIMQNFTYDPELISVLALEIACPGTLEASGPWARYEIAGIEAYSELYVRCHMEDIVMGWDEARGEQPAWADLDDRQRHMVIANVAHYHQTADSDYFDDEWPGRIASVFEDDIVGDPGFVFRNY